MFLTKEAVRLAEPGHAVGVACDGCPPLERLFEQFAEAGASFWPARSASTRAAWTPTASWPTPAWPAAHRCSTGSATRAARSSATDRPRASRGSPRPVGRAFAGHRAYLSDERGARSAAGPRGVGQRLPARQGRRRRGDRVGPGALGLRARAAVPRAVGGAADGARHRLPHLRPRRAAGRLRLPRRAARVRRRRGLRRQRGSPGRRAAAGAGRGHDARPARRVHDRRHHGARGPPRRLQRRPGMLGDAAARHADRHRRRPARQPRSSGRRCAIAPRRGGSTSSTIAWALCSATWRAPCAKGARRRSGAMGRAHARARPATSPTPGPSCARRARAGA